MSEARKNIQKIIEEQNLEEFEKIFKVWLAINPFPGSETDLKKIKNYLFGVKQVNHYDAFLQENRKERYLLHEWFETTKLLHHSIKYKKLHFIIVDRPEKWSFEHTILTPTEEMVRIKNLDEAMLRKEERNRVKKVEYNRNKNKK